ncbi:hypothetical protein SHKM778_31550 [Streptomyces sp. KM77-8]|uniref:Uncharacterized protein n=1 Tax=Streptomyces haneummycinicus TaxID=3074435 RepID=A0AAT9HHG8_9ACTN
MRVPGPPRGRDLLPKSGRRRLSACGPRGSALFRREGLAPRPMRAGARGARVGGMKRLLEILGFLAVVQGWWVW